MHSSPTAKEMKSSLHLKKVLIGLEVRGFTLLEPYRNMISKHLVRCPEGHEYRCRIDSLLYARQHGCVVCRNSNLVIGNEKSVQFADSKGWSIKDIPHKITQGVLLTFGCKKCFTEMTKSFGQFRYYNKCQVCSGTAPQWVFNFSKSYQHFTIVNRTKFRVEVKCLNCGFNGDLSISEIVTRRHCTCRPLKYFSSPFDLWGYVILKPLIKKPRKDRNTYEVRCHNGHRFSSAARSLLAGHGCFKCAVSFKLTEPEIEIRRFFVSNGFTTEVRNRTVLHGKELDLYIPDLKLAVEYAGIRFHSEEFYLKTAQKVTPEKLAKFRLKRQMKMLECLTKNIRLITLFEHEWLFNRNMVLDRFGKIIAGETLATKDLCWVSPCGEISQPRARYFSPHRREIEGAEEKENPAFTVYDCGVSLYSY